MNDTLPAKYPRSLLKMIPKEQHADMLMDSANLRLEHIRGDKTITTRQYSRLFSAIVRSLQPSLHGKEDAIFSQFSHYRLILNSMIQAKNLRDAIVMADIYFRKLSADNMAIPMRESTHSVRLEFSYYKDQINEHPWTQHNFSKKNFNCGPGIIGRSVNQWIWHRLLAWLVGEYIDIEDAGISDKEPAHPENYHRLFCTNVSFSQPSYYLTFSSHHLDKPIVQTVESVELMLSSFPEALFDIQYKRRSLFDQISTIINKDLSQPFPTIEEIAQQKNISVPTLHRRLKSENTSYQKIKDECRMKAATKLLSRPDLSIKEAADLLGFSEASSFHRAFKKWTNISPTQHRKKHLSNND